MDKNEELLSILRDCVVRIDLGDQQIATGFFIGQDLAVSCAHVVRDKRRISVRWKERTSLAEVLEVSDSKYPDVALLKCDFDYHPAVLLEPAIEIGDTLLARGFTENYNEGDDLTLVFEGFSGDRRMRLLKLKAGQIEPGFSGAPLFNLRTRCVVGMVKTTRNRDYSMGGRAIPATAILQVARIADANWNWHSRNRLWCDTAGVNFANKGRERGQLTTFQDYTVALLNRLSSRFVAGSERVRLHHLFEGSKLFRRFRWRSAGLKEPTEELLPMLANSAESRSAARYLILSDPGVGKSTLLIAVFWWMSSREDSTCIDLPRFPILLDARDYIGVEGFGSVDWLVTYLDRLFGVAIEWTGIPVTKGRGPKATPVILLDSLDEYLAGMPPSKAEREVAKTLFREARLISCRLQFFERFLAKGDFAETVDKIEILPWKWPDIEEYARGYVAQFGRFSGTTDQLIEQLASLPLLDVCSVPLRLNMMLEVWGTGEGAVEQLTSLASLYAEYVFSWLSREAGRPGSVLNVDEKLHLLREVAWQSYEYSKGIGSTRLNREELRKIVKLCGFQSCFAEDQVLDDLQYRTLFIHEAVPLITGEGALSFAHKSFQEFLVASHLFEQLLHDAGKAVIDFGTPISPEVSEFLKEIIAGANADPGLRERAIDGAVRAFLESSELASQNEQDERRLARQQLAYYLGNLRSDRATEFLRRRLDLEVDPFTRRGIIIGLAFGGYSELITSYVDRLRSERAQEHGAEAIENQVNLGFHLSFFGDQPFDVLQPERDQGLPHCDKTIKRLIYQLRTNVDRASWRLNLYTILDFTSNRLSSRDSCLESLKECLADLRRVLKNLANDPECREWPEIDELRKLAAKVERQGKRSRRKK